MTSKKQSGPLDLSGVEEAIKRQDAGIPVEIVGLDGKTPLGLTIYVAGPDSQRASQAQEALADEMIAKERLDKMSAKEAVDRGIRYLARVTLAWEPAVKLGGDEMAYSVKNAEALYRKFRFIREQVDRAAGNRARFIEG